MERKTYKKKRRAWPSTKSFNPKEKAGGGVKGAPREGKGPHLLDARNMKGTQTAMQTKGKTFYYSTEGLAEKRNLDKACGKKNRKPRWKGGKYFDP